MPENDLLEIFPWQDNFETGIPTIDEQHKKLVSLLNQLAGHLAYGSHNPLIGEVLQELADYTDYHFTTEEKIWAEHLPEDAAYINHQKLHNSFINQLHQIKTHDIESDNFVSELVAFLTHWLAYHILDSDKRMAKTIEGLKQGKSIPDAKEYADSHMSGLMQTLIQTILGMYQSLSTRTLDLMREKHLRQQTEYKLQIKEQSLQFIVESNEDEFWDWVAEERNVQDDLKSEDILCMLSIHEDDIDEFVRDVEDHLNGHAPYFCNRHRIKTENGQWKWVLSRGKVVSRDDRGHVERMIGTHTDITDRELSIAVFKNANEAIIISDKNNQIIAVNPAFSSITGYEDHEVIGQNPKILGSGKHDSQFYQEMWDSLNKTGFWKGEIWNKRKSEELYPEQISITTVKNHRKEVEYYIALFTDITERKKLDTQLEHHATFDVLTGVYNRFSFNIALKHQLDNYPRNPGLIVLMFIDLDLFKEVNDSMGHILGDEILKVAASRIQKCSRKSDLTARIGGDEFVVLLPGVDDLSRIDQIAGNILEALKQPFSLEGREVILSASIGIAVFPDNAADADTLLIRADQAMYRAKENGRDCYQYFTSSMQSEAESRATTISDLHLAIKHNQFQLYYQPIVDLSTGRIEKAEALIRWFHPERGIVPPIEFIELSERSGLIRAIGTWVLEEATRAVEEWNRTDCDKMQVSVNISPMQLREDSSGKYDLKQFFSTLKDPNSIVIELTETAIFEGSEQQRTLLIELGDLGVEAALDDFGTGYSSLSNLMDLSVDYIKIDRSFVKRIIDDEKTSTICEATIAMAEKLGIKVIAEGIETPEQLEKLKAVGCHYGQGYLISRPVPKEEFDSFLYSKKTVWS